VYRECFKRLGSDRYAWLLDRTWVWHQTRLPDQGSWTWRSGQTQTNNEKMIIVHFSCQEKERKKRKKTQTIDC
jgi:hypothetical protein